MDDDIAQEKVIAIDAAQDFHVQVTAFKQSFIYTIALYQPLAGGGFGPGKVIGQGDSQHQQWIGLGADLDGCKLKIGIAQLGNTPLSAYPINVLAEVGNHNGARETIAHWTIPLGQKSGTTTWIAVLFS